MHVADVTMFYAPQSGGVRRYVEAKRAWLNAHRGFSHTLLVPGSRATAAESRTLSLPSVPLPLSHGYRLPLGKSHAVRTLVKLRPTLIEAGDPYHLAWAALEAGQRLGVPVIGFCHSDLPRVLGSRLGVRAERVAALYYARLYRHFDLVLAPSATMTARLRGWDVARARHQPLGVDLDLFNPQRRDPGLREQLGLAAAPRVLAYAGRFAPEKNLAVLVEAMRRLGPRYTALLIGAGNAPARLPANVRVVPYLAAPSATGGRSSFRKSPRATARSSRTVL